MKEKPKTETLDEQLGRPDGSFKKYAEKKESEIIEQEAKRKKRIINWRRGDKPNP